MSESHYNKKLKQFARELRNDSTDGEIILWKEVLSGKRMYNYQFNRQFSIDNYIVDFICRKLKLIIEVDGYSHQFKIEKDRLIEIQIEKYGFKVLRIDEYEIKKNLNNVVRIIEATIQDIEKKIVK